MSLTYQICEVTVTLPSLGTITTDGPGNQIKHGDKCRVDLYAVKPDWRSGSSFEGFIVGWLTFEGYCETPYSRSQKIMMPAGYKLVALMVDEYGIPTSWDSLPVHFSGGPIGTPVDALDGIADLPLYSISSDLAIQQKIADALDTALARYHVQYGNSEPEKTPVVFLAERWVALEGKYTAEEIRDAVEHIKRTRLAKKLRKSLEEISPFSVKDGQVFIKDAFIGGGVVSANYSVKMGMDHTGIQHAAGMSLGVNGDQSKVVFAADRYKVHEAASSITENVKTKIKLGDEMKQAVIDAVRESDLFESLLAGLNAQAASIDGLQRAISDAVTDAIKNALKPGGMLWNKRGGY